MRPCLLAAAVLLTAALALACGPDIRPPAGRPTAAVPEIDARLRPLGAGIIEISLEPGGVQDLDPLGMSLNIGVTPPPCAGFIMDFTWQVITPDPPAGVAVGFLGERMGGRFEVAAPAPSGEGTIGCALLQAVNASQQALRLQLRFVVATPRD